MSAVYTERHIRYKHPRNFGENCKKVQTWEFKLNFSFEKNGDLEIAESLVSIVFWKNAVFLV